MVGLRYELLLWRFWGWFKCEYSPEALEASFDTGFGKLLPTWAGLRANARQAVANRLRYVKARILRMLIHRLEIDQGEERQNTKAKIQGSRAFQLYDDECSR